MAFSAINYDEQRENHRSLTLTKLAKTNDRISAKDIAYGVGCILLLVPFIVGHLLVDIKKRIQKK